MLRTPRTFAEIARVGPIANQGRTIDETVTRPAPHRRRRRRAARGDAGQRDARCCARRWRDELGMALDRVVVNALLPGALRPAAGRARWRGALERRAHRSSGPRCARRCPSTPAPRRQREQLARLAEATGREPRTAALPVRARAGAGRVRVALARAGGGEPVSVAELLAGKRVCICGGSGGVGKTTTSAAIAMGMAAEGRKVAVVTIDPASGWPTRSGSTELGNEPRLVEPGVFEAAGLEMQGRAVGDDARRQAHVRRGDRAPRARRAHARRRSSPTASTASCRTRSPARRSTRP